MHLLVPAAAGLVETKAGSDNNMKNRTRSAALLLLCGLLLHAALAPAAAAATKWVVFVYMLADNDLEQFGLMDMEVSEDNPSQRPQCCNWQHAPALCLC